MLFNTIAQVQSLDNDVIRKHLENSKYFDGIQGRYVWGGMETYGNNHQVNAPFFVGQVVNGKEVMRTKINP
jgi:branched-chain amino acid transport system substrate-binding protein